MKETENDKCADKDVDQRDHSWTDRGTFDAITLENHFTVSAATDLMHIL